MDHLVINASSAYVLDIVSYSYAVSVHAYARLVRVRDDTNI